MSRETIKDGGVIERLQGPGVGPDLGTAPSPVDGLSPRARRLFVQDLGLSGNDLLQVARGLMRLSPDQDQQLQSIENASYEASLGCRVFAAGGPATGAAMYKQASERLIGMLNHLRKLGR